MATGQMPSPERVRGRNFQLPLWHGLCQRGQGDSWILLYLQVPVVTGGAKLSGGAVSTDVSVSSSASFINWKPEARLCKGLGWSEGREGGW